MGVKKIAANIMCDYLFTGIFYTNDQFSVI